MPFYRIAIDSTDPALCIVRTKHTLESHGSWWTVLRWPLTILLSSGVQMDWVV